MRRLISLLIMCCAQGLEPMPLRALKLGPVAPGLNRWDDFTWSFVLGALQGLGLELLHTKGKDLGRPWGRLELLEVHGADEEQQKQLQQVGAGGGLSGAFVSQCQWLSYHVVFAEPFGWSVCKASWQHEI
jgi:hypothetical protein